MRSLSLAAVFLALVPAAYTAEKPGPFADVPKAHWAYEAVETAERSGVFTGYPPGTFAGQRALTRYEFAVAVQRMSRDLARGTEVAGDTPEQQLRVAALEHLGVHRKPVGPTFVRLADEFEPELKLLGTTADRVKTDIGSAKPAARPIPARPASPSKDYNRGAQEARDQWKRGEVVIYTAGLPTVSFDEKLAVPHRQVAGCIISEETRELMAGHNSEVYRLALELGLPANHRREWLAELTDPARLWAENRVPKSMLVPGGDFAAAPQGGVRARIRVEGSDPSEALEIQRDGKVIATLGLGNARKGGSSPEIAWAANGELLFLRYATNANEGRGHGHLVYDTRAGAPIARGFSSGVAGK